MAVPTQFGQEISGILNSAATTCANIATNAKAVLDANDGVLTELERLIAECDEKCECEDRRLFLEVKEKVLN